ncbi:hypothetical protein BDV93DRAFT_266734 [Ceratobasidium sp. AG-I]|nr:hypothetical protein BDV93DRAFT_266734 [Ceratobasidium sp. AG-I]
MYRWAWDVVWAWDRMGSLLGLGWTRRRFVNHWCVCFRCLAFVSSYPDDIFVQRLLGAVGFNALICYLPSSNGSSRDVDFRRISPSPTPNGCSPALSSVVSPGSRSLAILQLENASDASRRVGGSSRLVGTTSGVVGVVYVRVPPSLRSSSSCTIAIITLGSWTSQLALAGAI